MPKRIDGQSTEHTRLAATKGKSLKQKKYGFTFQIARYASLVWDTLSPTRLAATNDSILKQKAYIIAIFLLI